MNPVSKRRCARDHAYRELTGLQRQPADSRRDWTAASRRAMKCLMFCSLQQLEHRCRCRFRQVGARGFHGFARGVHRAMAARARAEAGVDGAPGADPARSGRAPRLAVLPVVPPPAGGRTHARRLRMLEQEPLRPDAELAGRHRRAGEPPPLDALPLPRTPCPCPARARDRDLRRRSAAGSAVTRCAKKTTLRRGGGHLLQRASANLTCACRSSQSAPLADPRQGDW